MSGRNPTQRNQESDGFAQQDLFAVFQAQYLQGRWCEAEGSLRQLIGSDPRDAEARLMLATLCRHTRRCQEAEGWLRQLEQLDGAGRWQWEVEREWERLRRLRADSPGDQKGALESGSRANLRRSA